MSTNMSCVAHKYRMRKDRELEEAFQRLANVLEAIESHLTFDVVYALRESKNATIHSGADGIRATGESLLHAIDNCPVKSRQIHEAARALRDKLFE